MSQLLEMLGCKYPIIQGPIAALNSPKLIAAISEAGGFGMLALGFSTPEEVERLVGEVRALTDKPFGANIMIMNPSNPQILEILARSGVKTLTTSAGSPGKIYPLIHQLGMKGLPVLLSMPHAVKAVNEGADGLVVSGAESGGLRTMGSESANMVLIPLVADQVKVPIVAAGGIADSRGYRAALALGAQGVQLGTRFIASEESPAPRVWKDAIVACSDGSTMLLTVKNMKMRVIGNKKLLDLTADPNRDLSEVYKLIDAPRGWLSGDFDLFPAGAGQVAALIKSVKPVRDIIAEMVATT
jgi:enoyl-[acyl-carrier protein] reductase II